MDTHLDALENFPDDADVLELTKGRAFLIKKDIFRNLMWYSLPESTKHYPVSIEGVKKVKEQNRHGIKPDTLETVEVISGKPKEVEPEFVDVVGQISLRSLDRKDKKRRDRERGRPREGGPRDQGPRQQGPRDQGPREQGPQQQNRPQQQGRQNQNRPQNQQRNQPRPPRPEPGK